MNKSHRTFSVASAIAFSCLVVAGCSGGAGTNPPGDGGASALGGANSGGVSSGGAPGQGGSGVGGSVSGGASSSSGGQAQGGAIGNGGKASSGGASTAQGGASSGGMSSRGGASSGGTSSSRGGGPSSGGASSGGSSSSSGGAAPATFAMAASIIGMRCGIAGCHGTGGQKPLLANNSSLYNTLKTVTVKECSGKALVVPNDAANSSLIKLTKWECMDGSNGPFVMPQGCIDDPCLNAQELATLTGWIAAGAPGP